MLRMYLIIGKDLYICGMSVEFRLHVTFRLGNLSLGLASKSVFNWTKFIINCH